MSDFAQACRNPFAPPSAPLEDAPPEGGVWSHGDCVILDPDADLPPRCVKCNEPAVLPVRKRTLYWHHPAIYLLLIFPGVLIYLIVGLIVRKKAQVSPGLCPLHNRRRNLGLALGWGGALAGIALLVAGVVLLDTSCLPGILGLVLLVGALVAGMVLTRTVHPSRIDRSYVRLKGCGPAFLGSLPFFRG